MLFFCDSIQRFPGNLIIYPDATYTTIRSISVEVGVLPVRCPVVHGAADGDALQEDAHLSNGVAGTNCSLYSTLLQ